MVGYRKFRLLWKFRSSCHMYWFLVHFVADQGLLAFSRIKNTKKHMNWWQTGATIFLSIFCSNNLNDSCLEILNRTRVTWFESSFLWIHGLFGAIRTTWERLTTRGHSGRGQKKWTQVPKSGGGISFVIGSRENCWKTAVEAYFWKVFKNVWPKVTLLRKP